jgi:hypothetical protein
VKWVKWNLVLVLLETVLVLVQHRCKDSPIITKGPKSFWMHPMVLLGDEAHVEAHFSPFGESANLDAREVHGLR